VCDVRLPGKQPKMTEITLQSTAFSDHDFVPRAYSHEEGDLSPPLEWSGIPEDAAELVIVCEDPDAPVGTFTHWLVAGIPPEEGVIDPGEEPAGSVPGRNDYGGLGYGGPHPPAGDQPHRYIFRMYALEEPSGLDEGFTAEDLDGVTDSGIVASGALVATYGR
jgi:Raf kinase inhibitor-like YbhB/YbcL family protein